MSKDTFQFSMTDAPVEGVEREKQMICGCKIIELGDIKDDRPQLVDQQTLEQVVEFGNKTKVGLKARITHPEQDSIFYGIGRWKNFRIDGDAVRADLHLSKSASKNPMGDLAEFVLSIAEEDASFCGISIAGKLNLEAMELEESFPAPIRLKSLKAADLVGEPAATTGLFHEQKETSDEVMEMTEKKEEVQEEVKETPVVLEEEKNEKTELELLKEEVEALKKEKADRLELARYCETFGDEAGNAWFSENKSFEEGCIEYISKQKELIAEYRVQLSELKSEFESLREGLGEDSPVKTDEEQELSEGETLKQEMLEMGATKSQAQIASLIKFK